MQWELYQSLPFGRGLRKWEKVRALIKWNIVYLDHMELSHTHA